MFWEGGRAMGWMGNYGAQSQIGSAVGSDLFHMDNVAS
jgi:hypothetical protein